MTTSTADSSPSSPIAGAPNVSAPAPVRHTWIDNLQGQAFGVVMIAFGMSMLHSLGLITGQVAGLAFLVTYATGMSFGMAFTLINLPFICWPPCAWARPSPGAPWRRSRRYR